MLVAGGLIAVFACGCVTLAMRRRRRTIARQRIIDKDRVRNMRRSVRRMSLQAREKRHSLSLALNSKTQPIDQQHGWADGDDGLVQVLVARGMEPDTVAKLRDSMTGAVRESRLAEERPGMLPFLHQNRQQQEVEAALEREEDERRLDLQQQPQHQEAAMMEKRPSGPRLLRQLSDHGDGVIAAEAEASRGTRKKKGKRRRKSHGQSRRRRKGRKSRGSRGKSGNRRRHRRKLGDRPAMSPVPEHTPTTDKGMHSAISVARLRRTMDKALEAESRTAVPSRGASFRRHTASAKDVLAQATASEEGPAEAEEPAVPRTNSFRRRTASAKDLLPRSRSFAGAATPAAPAVSARGPQVSDLLPTPKPPAGSLLARQSALRKHRSMHSIRTSTLTGGSTSLNSAMFANAFFSSESLVAQLNEGAGAGKQPRPNAFRQEDPRKLSILTRSSSATSMNSAMNAFYSSPSLLEEIEAAQGNASDPTPQPRPTSRTCRKKQRRSSIATPYGHGEGVAGAQDERSRERTKFEKYYKLAGMKWQSVHVGK